MKTFLPDTGERQLTLSTGLLLPWQHAAGWLNGMWVEKPISSVTSGDKQKHQMFYACVWKVNELMCVYVRMWCDLVSALATQLYLHTPVMKRTVNKGRNCSSMTGMTRCYIKAVDACAFTHVRIHTSRGVVSLVPPNDCSPHYLPAVCGCVQERVDMKREQFDVHSPSSWSLFKKSQRKIVMIWFSLHSSLPWIYPHAAFHPHYHSSDGTFYLLPFWLFSHSFLPPIHTLSFFLLLFVMLLQFVLHSSFVIPELYLFLSAIFSLFRSVHPTLAYFFLLLFVFV